MVGDEVPGGGGSAELTGAELAAAELAAGLRAGYDAAAGDWAEGPGPMYAPLARALVAAAPVPLAGRLVLDLGAGGGVAGQAALAAGATTASSGQPWATRRGTRCGEPAAASAAAIHGESSR